jgi:GxxExxY protein
VLEIKSGEKFLKQNISQIYSYLKIKNLKLGILANFTKEGLKFKRIVNLN